MCHGQHREISFVFVKLGACSGCGLLWLPWWGVVSVSDAARSRRMVAMGCVWATMRIVELSSFMPGFWRGPELIPTPLLFRRQVIGDPLIVQFCLGYKKVFACVHGSLCEVLSTYLWALHMSVEKHKDSSEASSVSFLDVSGNCEVGIYWFLRWFHMSIAILVWATCFPCGVFSYQNRPPTLLEEA